MINLAYFSPLNPQKSGISDFSEELLPYLKQHMNIDLFVQDYNPVNEQIVSQFKIYPIARYEDPSVRELYDLAVFHVGNNLQFHKGIVESFLKYGGILELHEISLHHYVAEDTVVKQDFEEYLRIMKYCHGIKGEKAARDFIDGKLVAPWETKALELTLSKHLVDKAFAVIVHSDMAKQMIRGISPKIPIKRILLHTIKIQEDRQHEKLCCREALGIDADAFILGSFGNATPTRRIESVLTALGRLKENGMPHFHYYIVGQLNDVKLKKMIRDLDLTAYVTVTGYLELKDFEAHMSACDVAFNLRYPTHGESSASLHRLLGLGVPSFVTVVGSFEEYPDNVVVKISHDSREIDEIYENLENLYCDRDSLSERAQASTVFARGHCDIEKNALEYAVFFDRLLGHSYGEEDYLDLLLDRLTELGLDQEEYLRHLLSWAADFVSV